MLAGMYLTMGLVGPIIEIDSLFLNYGPWCGPKNFFVGQCVICGVFIGNGFGGLKLFILIFT